MRWLKCTREPIICPGKGNGRCPQRAPVSSPKEADIDERALGGHSASKGRTGSDKKFIAKVLAVEQSAIWRCYRWKMKSSLKTHALKIALPKLQDSVTVVGYPIGGVAIVTSSESRGSNAIRARRDGVVRFAD